MKFSTNAKVQIWNVISYCNPIAIGRHFHIMLHSLITVLWYPLEIMSKSWGIDICGRLHIEFPYKRRWIDVSFTSHRNVVTRAKFHRPNAFFNRVLTQLDHDGGIRFRCSRAGSSCGIYGVSQRPECEGSRHAKPCRRMMGKRVRCTLLVCVLLRF